MNVEELIKLLEQKIRVIRRGKFSDYKEGLIDGLIIAIRTIEN